MWRDLFWSLIIRRTIIVVDGLELTLKLSLSLPCGLNFSTLSCQSRLLLLCLGLSRLLAALLFFLLDLTSLDLLLEGLEAGLSCLTLLCKLTFLTLSVVPIMS